MTISILKQGKSIEQKILELNADANVRYYNGTILILINYISNAGLKELLDFCSVFDTGCCKNLDCIYPLNRDSIYPLHNEPSRELGHHDPKESFNSYDFLQVGSLKEIKVLIVRD